MVHDSPPFSVMITVAIRQGKPHTACQHFEFLAQARGLCSSRATLQGCRMRAWAIFATAHAEADAGTWGMLHDVRA